MHVWSCFAIHILEPNLELSVLDGFTSRQWDKLKHFQQEDETEVRCGHRFLGLGVCVCEL